MVAAYKLMGRDAAGHAGFRGEGDAMMKFEGLGELMAAGVVALILIGGIAGAVVMWVIR